MQLINKDIKNIKELQNFLKDEKAISDSIPDVINFFKIKKITNFLNSIKRCGIRATSIVFTLLLLPFANVFSIRSMYMSGLFNLKEGKDIFYDLKKNIKVDWRKLLYFFSKRYKTVVNKNADLIRDGISCLIADDTVLLKEGTKIEFAGKIWNHALN